MRWLWGLGLLTGCGDLSGTWAGDCDYEGGLDNDRSVRLVLQLDSPSEGGVGAGTGKVISEDETIKADVVYLSSDKDIVAIDVYPDEGRDLFLRGHFKKSGISGKCGDESPTTLDFDAAIECAAKLKANCHEATEWKPGKRPAPVTADDLSGHFALKSR